MTIDEFQRIVLSLSNQTYVRWWTHWNYPDSPVMMAIGLHGSIRAGFIAEMADRGFTWEPPMYLTIQRTNDDGTPYISKL